MLSQKMSPRNGNSKQTKNPLVEPFYKPFGAPFFGTPKTHGNPIKISSDVIYKFSPENSLKAWSVSAYQSVNQYRHK